MNKLLVLLTLDAAANTEQLVTAHLKTEPPSSCKVVTHRDSGFGFMDWGLWDEHVVLWLHLLGGPKQAAEYMQPSS